MAGIQLPTAWEVLHVHYPIGMESPYEGGNGFVFNFNDGRVFEIVNQHFPRRITFKRWCPVTLDEFHNIMTEAFNTL